MPSPREIAKKVNDPSMFEDPEPGYDGEAGVPSSVGGKVSERDYAVHATNPPEKPCPCKNLKK